MIKIEPTGVLFEGICDIQTEKCTARTTAPLTAVWSLPGRVQINVCRACLDEMVRRGEWEVTGARLSRRADVAVFDPAGSLQMIIEAKSLPAEDDTPKRAIQIRRNLLAHAGLPPTPFFLLAFPEHFYLWKQACPDPYDRPADYRVDAKDIVTTYAERRQTGMADATAGDFEALILAWVHDLIQATDETQAPPWVKASGLYQAIKNGAALVEVAI